MTLSFAKFINVVHAEISFLLPHRSKMVDAAGQVVSSAKKHLKSFILRL